MSYTPRTNKEYRRLGLTYFGTGTPHKEHVSADFARTLERELAAKDAALKKAVELIREIVAHPQTETFFDDWARRLAELEKELKP